MPRPEGDDHGPADAEDYLGGLFCDIFEYLSCPIKARDANSGQNIPKCWLYGYFYIAKPGDSSAGDAAASGASSFAGESSFVEAFRLPVLQVSV